MPVFVIEGNDIQLYDDAAAAAQSVEGYDADDLRYLGIDGTVYVGMAGQSLSGPIVLTPTQDQQRDELVARLRAAAAAGAIQLAPDLPDDPELIWAAIVAGKPGSGSGRGRHRR
jgi:hypothetical protein